MLILIICKGFGGEFISAIEKYMCYIAGYAFIDDIVFLQNVHFGYDMIEDVVFEIYNEIVM